VDLLPEAVSDATPRASCSESHLDVVSALHLKDVKDHCEQI
jgi:hypothetical protein